MRVQFIAGSLVLILLASGCAPASRLSLERRAGGSAALFNQFRVYDARTGAAVDYARLASDARAADAVLFGESHDDPICNALEAQLYADMLASGRAALVMEFFERDAQAALDDYLAGRISEAAFTESARTSRGYALSHRPLVEMARAAEMPVVAANAPRRLVRDYRESEKDYAAFFAGLPADDQRWLPPQNELLTGPYRDAFVGMMEGHGAATSTPSTAPAKPGVKPEDFYRAQMLWDEAMAESLAATRARDPGAAALLVVGSFHVANAGGLARKFAARRPDDRALIVIYRSGDDGDLAFDEASDLNCGDYVIRGVAKKPASDS